MSFDPKPYEVGLALLHWLAVFGSCLAIVFIVSLSSALALGRAGDVINAITSGIGDFLSTSPRRIFAIGLLTFREAIRRKALLVFFVFAALFMFAGWFLSNASSRPDLQAKAYVVFVLTSISFLILPVVLLLACWGVPEDIRLRSMHTVVTKPIRRHEIVCGRMLGYSIVGTIVLVLMGVIGYVWIFRQVADDAKQNLVARVPVYGQLTFMSREGSEAKSGINTGDIWDFRSYIEGATKARAIWKFENVNADRIGDQLVLETKFEAFRTHKGDINKGLLGRLIFVNPSKNIKVPHKPFEVKEYRENKMTIERKLTLIEENTGKVLEYDLFNDLVVDNTLTVEVQCLDAGQYLGMARPDLFVRLPDRHFAVSYSKSIVGIWLLMNMIIMLGVSVSCFVKGPVATLVVFTFLIIGQGLREFMGRVVSGAEKGSGLFESVYRLINHMNPVTELDESPVTKVILSVDWVFKQMLWLVQHVIPDFSFYRMSPYVANGFDVSWQAAMLPSLLITLGYVLPCILIGYYTLRFRELEAK
ncbi:MAG: ABC transporter permease [Planctomycetaceae bacterium]